MRTPNVMERFVKLPDDVQREALDYIDYLLKKYEKADGKTGLSFNWEGGLADLKGTHSAVQLQHKASEWR